jgi:hypothetical protein
MHDGGTLSTTRPHVHRECGCRDARAKRPPCGCAKGAVVDSTEDDVPPRLAGTATLNARMSAPRRPTVVAPEPTASLIERVDRLASAREEPDAADKKLSERRLVESVAAEVLTSLRRYGSLAGPPGPAGISAVLSRQVAELVTTSATTLNAITYTMQSESKVKARAWILATGVDDPASHRWWEIQATFRRGVGAANAVVSGATAVVGGQEGTNAGSWSAAIVANASGGIDVQVTGSTSEANWVCVLMIESQDLDCFCSYRTITKGGAALSSSLVAGQLCTSIQRGSSFYSKFFRLDVSVGTTITIDLSSVVFDTYLYLLKGTSKYGALLAQDDDAGPGTDSQIVYTTSASVGTQLTIDCTSYGAGATGAFTVSVT